MFKKQIITKSSRETKEFAGKLIRELLKSSKNKNLVICLEGNLGGGKTTFVQGLAEGLGIKEIVNSPTFLIMKKYTVVKNRTKKYNSSPRRSLSAEDCDEQTHKSLESSAERLQRGESEEALNLYHFDCYRISSYQEILDLGFEEIISGKNNIVAIEWSEKIKEILPKERINIKFEFVDEKTRKIKY